MAIETAMGLNSNESNALLRLQFFRDLVESQRAKVYAEAGLPVDEGLNHGIEMHMFGWLLRNGKADLIIAALSSAREAEAMTPRVGRRED